MNFLVGLALVIAGAFAMFYVAQAMLKSTNPERPFGWCLTVGIMSFGVMVIYRLLDYGINIPFGTVVLFILTVGGMDSNFDESLANYFKPAIKKARCFAATGGFLGWMTYAKYVNA